MSVEETNLGGTMNYIELSIFTKLWVWEDTLEVMGSKYEKSAIT